MTKIIFLTNNVLKFVFSKKRPFSQSTVASADRLSVNTLSKRLNKLEEKIKEISEDYEGLLKERESAKLHRLALVKRENDQPLSEEDQEAIEEIKGNYSAFFEEEVEESDPEMETSPEYKERKQVNQVMEYLASEIKSNKNEIEKLQDEHKKVKKILDTKKNISVAESSVAESSIAESSASSGEPSSRSGSTQVSQNTVDFVDNLPVDYNPFEDVGND